MRFIQIIQKVTLSFFHNIKNFNIMKMGKISALSALFIVATLISVFVFKSYVGSDNTIVEKNQQIILMQKGDLISEVSISGQLKFSTNEDLLFTSPGKISKIHVDENSTVSKGDILATLEDIKITELEKDVAQALANVETAKEALEDTINPYTNTQIATAEYQLSVTISSLLDAKDDLNNTKTGDPNLIALKGKAISDVKITLLKSEFDLNYYMQNGKKVDMDNAKSNYDIAKIAKDNSVRTLNLTKSQWAKTLEPYTEDIIKFKNEYFDNLNKWFGIKTDSKYLISTDEILKSWNTSLTQIFTEGAITRDIYLNPIDNIKTQWNELTIYGWLHLSPATIGDESSSKDIWITCDNTPVLPVNTIGTVTIVKTCIKKELKDSWDTYNTAISTLNEKNIEKDKAIDTAESTFQNKSALFRTAEQTYKEILSRSQTEKEEQLKHQLTINKETLKNLEEDLLKLKNPSKLDISKKEYYVKQLEADTKDKQEMLDEMKMGGKTESINLKEAQLKNTQALLRNSQNILSGAILKAPFDGIITDIKFEEGDTITTNNVIINIANPNNVEFTGDVDEVDVLYLKQNLKAIIITDALKDIELDGELFNVASASTASQGVRSFQVKISVIVPENIKLKDGLSATARVITKAKYGINLIPIQSLYGTFDNPTVKIINNGEIIEQIITIGDSDAIWVEVLSGINSNDMIVMEVPNIPTRDIRGGPPSAEPRSRGPID
ncbi:MAG TPA: efflux RND transporter periplasmic adaptor subunit [Dehalococcoidia bacterium]|nr:efflux RND transporter periplasmic adaptor subunit [Dehalococcoidia bacterium]